MPAPGEPRPLPHRVSELEHCSKDHAGPQNVQPIDKSVRAKQPKAVNDASRHIVGISLPDMFLFGLGALVTGVAARRAGAPFCEGSCVLVEIILVVAGPRRQAPGNPR